MENGMYSCIIIDDEPRARALLQAMIAQHCPQLTVVQQCEDLPAGVKAINKHKPALVFLDIEMPGHSGLEILDFFNPEEVQYRIIFTTAYSEYALQAFRFSAIDYLLKPIKPALLAEAVQRFVSTSQQSQAQQLKVLQENLDARNNWQHKRITLSTGQGMHFLQPADIVMVKGESAYSDFYLANGSRLLVSKNLKHFEELLAPLPMFYRCHKSFIVNLQHTLRYVRADGGHLLMTGQLEALVSPDRLDELLRRLENGGL
ncbi:MAG: LytTR family DNA-binding domain-containing protein [Chitinophagaceae bacterium]|jgi:two-component system LytT family response regulator|nr:LytTR family DNA-binding domain-containing protein [Chitinophagaceae bacterium]